jgi:hypothetical protein
MAKSVFYTASTLDGFIATDDHSLDWLVTRDVGQDGPLDHAAFIAGIGSLCMGAHTYEWVYRACQDASGAETQPWGYTQGSGEGVVDLLGDLCEHVEPAADLFRHPARQPAGGGEDETIGHRGADAVQRCENATTHGVDGERTGLANRGQAPEVKPGARVDSLGERIEVGGGQLVEVERDGTEPRPGRVGAHQ